MKSGDKVRMRDGYGYVYGEVTIVRLNEGFIKGLPKDAVVCKVLFQGNNDLDYWYYPAKDLELIDNKT